MSYYDQETLCEMEFQKVSPCWHLWTPENFELIFADTTDFRAGMTIIGICSKLFPELVILTFEIMSNHLHFTLSGTEYDLTYFFKRLKGMLKSHFKSQGRLLDWDSFRENHRMLDTVEDARNVIAYDNRNGFVVNKMCTPFTYPWGANRYYFNPDAKQLALSQAKKIYIREQRSFSRASDVDNITGLLKFEGCALPLSFCDIAQGELFFHSPSHYFSKISKAIESNSKIAHEIGENIYYTDDDLFTAITHICKKEFDKASPNLLSADEKLSVARSIRHNYNASTKQIQRMLKVDADILAAIGIS